MVSDIFETEPFVEYSGSYTSQILRGNVFATETTATLSQKHDGKADSRSVRTVIADKTSGATSSSLNNFVNFLLSDRIKLSRSLGHGRNVYFNILTQEDHVFFDSLTPDIAEISTINGAKFVLAKTGSVGSNEFGIPSVSISSSFGIVLGYPPKNNPDGPATSQMTRSLGVDGGEVISDNKWVFSYPFEGKYRDLNRRFPSYISNKKYNVEITGAQRKNDFDISDHELGKISNPISTNRLKTLVVPFEGTNSNFLEAIRESFVPAKESLNNNFANAINLCSPSTNEIQRICFGIGDLFSRFVEKIRIQVDPLEIKAPFLIQTTFVTKQRGWKYGLWAGFPHQPIAVFRRNHYGQFRDMIEQRPVTKLYGVSKNEPLSAPVRIQFVSGTQAALTASDQKNLNTTDSGIYDFEAKSGKPYDDTLRPSDFN